MRQMDSGSAPKAKARARVTPPDHTVLPNTPGAIKRYQKFHGLPPTGVVDPRTGKHMQRNGTALGPNANGTWNSGTVWRA
jgi:peptidoglycan hydrolase-like protein with peptidoglycan-binding domain